jgi:hypothetical protein
MYAKKSRTKFLIQNLRFCLQFLFYATIFRPVNPSISTCICDLQVARMEGLLEML